MPYEENEEGKIEWIPTLEQWNAEWGHFPGEVRVEYDSDTNERIEIYEPTYLDRMQEWKEEENK